MTASADRRVLAMVEDIGRAAGGAERVAVDLACALDPSRFSSVVCATRWSPEASRRPDVAEARKMLEAAGVGFVGLERRSTFDLRAWAPVWRMLRGGEVQIVHAHLFGSNFWAALLRAASRSGAKVIAHEHMWSFQGQRARRTLDRRFIAPSADAFVAVSDAGRRLMVEVEGVAPERVVVMRNGIPDRVPGDGAAIRRELSIAPEAPVVGTVGLLRREKALEVLIEAADTLRETLPGIRVLIVGEGPERTALEALVRRRGLESVVTLTGTRLDVPDLLAALDVAVCCSDWEGAPLSVMEYMQVGLPTVATQVGGLPELIRDRVDGVLVAPRDPAALAREASALIADPARAARLGQAARERQRAEFSLEAMAERFQDLYERVLTRS